MSVVNHYNECERHLSVREDECERANAQHFDGSFRLVHGDNPPILSHIHLK
jgi:hypothetical protein